MTPSEIRAAIHAVTGDDAMTDAVMNIVRPKEMSWMEVVTYAGPCQDARGHDGYPYRVHTQDGLWCANHMDIRVEPTLAKARAACEAHHAEAHFARMRGA